MNEKKQQQKRAKFTSSLGFIMAAAGSAIGLGNLWKFPYVAGSNGGGIFFFFFILFTIVLGVPIIMCEMALGRHTQLSAVGSYEKINKKWSFVGGIGVFCSFVILSYYCVVGGWVLKYIFKYATGGNFGFDKTVYFNNFMTNSIEPVIWHILFVIICAFVILKGVVKGIEKASKIMMPCLFVLVILIAGYAVTLPNAFEGVKFLFVPNFDQCQSFGDVVKIMVAAMGQVFFSLSLGLGITITYGSYLKNDSNLPKDTAVITILDTLIAVFCGLTVFPVVFSFGLQPRAGAGLIFETLPVVFGSISGGAVIGIIFFILVFFAAATSAIALLEVVCSYFIDNIGWSRKKATLIVGTLVAFIGIFASLSMGSLSWFKILGMNLFDAMGYLTDKILMPLAAFFMCIFVNHIWKTKRVSEEIEIGAKSFKFRPIFEFIMKYIAPALILIIFIMGLIG